MIKSGVIWISGYSSAGKTTVSRLVVSILRSQNRSVILLDGDDLRSIFSKKWGYDRNDRLELARVYFRLCSHLSSQGQIVVIAAVALYDEVSQWLEEYVPNVIQVFLDVPETERRLRDSKGKNIYPENNDLASLYDGPAKNAIQLQSYGVETPEKLAEKIINYFEQRKTDEPAYGIRGHWNKYYLGRVAAPSDASAFAIEVGREISSSSVIIDVGCGNGRDSAWFADLGHKVLALDVSSSAISVSRRLYKNKSITFFEGNLTSYLAVTQNQDQVDVVYCRFVLHAMPLSEEKNLLRAAHTKLKEGGFLYIECRSINDPMAMLGEVISSTERIYGHYRRFIVKEELEDSLESIGFSIVYSMENDGLAINELENPVVIRLKAKKRA